MKKKWVDCIFLAIFMLMLTIPLLLLDTSEDLVSVQENRAMTKWPGFGFNKEINEWYGHYFEDRIGFRELAVRAHTKMIYKIFGEFSEELHMFGKNGYVFPADEGYVEAFQRLRTDERLIGDFATYLKNTNEYLKEKGIPFVFLAGLDKKTVYPEYMPDSINVKEDHESIMESLARHLEEAGVPYVIPTREYETAKKTKQIYNKMYDCAHWNDLGKMLAVRLVDEKLNEQGMDVPVIEEGDYNLTYERRQQLEFVEIPIDEDVPVYHLKQQPQLWDDHDLTNNMYLVDGTSLQFYGNVNAKEKKKILIFHDSFLHNSKEFYCARYSQVFLVSRQNYENLQYYVNLIQPDGVIYENAERAFVDDLYAYTNLAKVKYQPSYNSFGMLQKAEKSTEFTSQILEAENATVDGRKVTLDPERSYYVFRGTVHLPSHLAKSDGKLHLYAKYNNKYYEMNYLASNSDAPGIRQVGVSHTSQEMEFYVSLRKQKKMKGKMKLILVDEKEKTEYQVGSFSLDFDHS